MAELPSGTVTFLLTDVEGSTALWEEAPEAMRAALARHDALFEAAVAEHGGVHIRPRGEGDSRFAVFASAPRMPWLPPWRSSAPSRPSPGRRRARSGPDRRSTPARPSCATATTTARPSTAARGCAGSATAGRCCSRRRRPRLVRDDLPAGAQPASTWASTASRT